MRRRDVLRTAGAAVGLGAGVLGTGGAGAHPGPSYRPHGEVPLEGAKEAVVSADGRTAFVAATTGYATVDVSRYAEPTLLAERRDPLADREGGPLGGIYDVKQAGDTLLVVGPANPAGDVLQGLLVVDVSDPANPEERAFFPTDYPIHNCYLNDGYAYLTANDWERNPLVVVDVSGDEPVEVARWSLADRDERWLEVPAGVRTIHDVWVQGGIAYLVHWDAGTWVLDVSEPSDPSYVADFRGRPLDELRRLDGAAAVRRAAFTPPGNDHFAATNADGTLLGVGMESWALETEGEVVGGPSGIDLYDVSEPSAPERVASIEPPATDRPTSSGIWTTSHNFGFADGTLYTSWYHGGVKLFDVSDPADPREFAWWRDPDEARFWTARSAVPGEAFVASDMGSNYAGDDASLYVFPDHAGDQRDPPSLIRGNGTAGGDGTRGGAGATGGHGATDDGIVTASPTPTPTPESNSGAEPGAANATNATPTTGTRTSARSAPGFGPIAGGVALGVATLGMGYRRRREGEAGEGE
jgi:hypothetical protein